MWNWASDSTDELDWDAIVYSDHGLFASSSIDILLFASMPRDQAVMEEATPNKQIDGLKGFFHDNNWFFSC